MNLNHCKKDSILFEDLSSTSEWGKKPNSNPFYSNSNLGIWRNEEHIKDLLQEGFESYLQNEVVGWRSGKRIRIPFDVMHLMLGQNS